MCALTVACQAVAVCVSAISQVTLKHRVNLVLSGTHDYCTDCGASVLIDTVAWEVGVICLVIVSNPTCCASLLRTAQAAQPCIGLVVRSQKAVSPAVKH